MDDFTNSKTVAEHWLRANNSKFQLLSADQNENQFVFEDPDSQVSFVIGCPRKGETWSVCSEQESTLTQLQDVMEYLDSQENLTIGIVLDRVTRSLSPVPSSSPNKQECDDDDFEDAVDDDEENEDDDNEFDYYEDDGLDAEEEDVEEDKEDDSKMLEMFLEASGGKAKPSTIQRLVSDMKSLTKTGKKYGFSACPNGNNLFSWKVKLLDIPEDCRLGKDLQRYARDTKEEAVIQMEMLFPCDYPFSPPFLRVILPRFKFLTGHVTIGGSICMEMLTKSGWLPTNDIEGILVQVRSEILSDPNAALDSARWGVPYTEAEARDAFNRMVLRYGWDK